LEFGSGVIQALQAYHWPGNIRELRNVLERAALLSSDGVISTADLQFQLPRPSAGPAPVESDETSELTLEEVERKHIYYILHRENGKVDKAAARLGIPRSSLYVKIKQYGIN
jgi:transcriptional regulator of acetoin/glycerol metabolism